MSTGLVAATNAATTVYLDFLTQVVEAHVLDERLGVLSEEAIKRVNATTHIDPRVVKLMSISGKGGWSKDPAKRERYALNTNVTLLDHLLSIVRGAVMLAAMDYLVRNPETDRIVLDRRLRVVAAIAFLHDIDKALEYERGAELPPLVIEDALTRYGIRDFLSVAGVSLAPDQIRYMIEKAEASQELRSLPSELPPQEYEKPLTYVGLADKLDSRWLSSDPETGGVAGVVSYLEKNAVLENDLLRFWRPLVIFDPHHPFLLDEFQQSASWASLRVAHVPPLVEVHQDGRLFLLLPTMHFEAIVEKALQILGTRLPFNLELNISNRGVPDLFNGSPTHGELRDFIIGLDGRELGRLFQVKADLKDDLTLALDEVLGGHELGPRWPKGAGALISPFASQQGMSEHALNLLHLAGHAVLLLNLKQTLDKKSGLPTYDQREAALIAEVGQTPPDWLTAIEDDSSRRVLTGLWAMAEAQKDLTVAEAVWGDGGLLASWLEGTAEKPGFNHFITGRGAQVVEAVRSHFRQLGGGQRIRPLDEEALGRCLFTDQPVATDDTIDEALGLYEVKVSAFSGRDNRLESLTSDRAHTNVSPVSIAEHKLRARAKAIHVGRSDGVPTLISSPATSGLFGGLGLRADREIASLSLYDLSRQEIKKGTVYHGLEGYRGRYRMARLERLGEKSATQVDQLRLLLQACRRIGRPIHVFRGLPTPQRAFFYYDAMPRMLSDLAGSNSLRLEEIPEALRRLEMALVIMNTQGLGYDVMRLYSSSTTRLRAICLAWCHLHEQNDASTNGIRNQLQSQYQLEREEKGMTASDGVLVRLGQAAAGIQRKVSKLASTNEEMLVFKICMDNAATARNTSQDDEKSMIYAIASELEINLVRKEQAAAREHRNDKTLRDGCLGVAELFVRDVWQGVLKRRPPSQRNQRFFGAVYRMAFLDAQNTRPTTA